MSNLSKINHNKFQSCTPFITEQGSSVPELSLSYKTWGELSENRDNAVLICHALTGSSDADEWFEGLFRQNGFLRQGKYFVICINVPGSCYGSTGPVSINPETGNRWMSDFPVFSIRDLVKAQQLVLDDLGIREVQIAIGGSMGGMQALEFVLMDERIKTAAVLATGARHESWAIGISEAQRHAIYADKNWNNGDYDILKPPSRGLAAARMMGMITYRTHPQYVNRFDRETRDDDLFQVSSYLKYQGEKLARRFDALSYIRLTQSMDTHDVGRGRGGIQNALSGCTKPVLVVGINSDLLYPVSEQKKLAESLPLGQYREIDSDYGHDAFLIEFETLNSILLEFKEQHFINHIKQ